MMLSGSIPSTDLAITVALNGWIASSSSLWMLGRLLNGGADLFVACTAIGIWFSSRPGSRTFALSFLIALFPAYISGRLLQHLFSRPRPFLAIPLLSRPGQEWWIQENTSFAGRGSLPSDHAMLFALLLWAAWGVNRRLAYAIGAFFSVYALFRIGMGYHWPSDMLAGILLGAGLAALMSLLNHRLPALLQTAVTALETHPASACVISFLILFDFAQGFKHVRLIAEDVFALHLFH